MALARHPECLDAELIETIRTLADDPVAAVRLQITDHLGYLYLTAPDLMWELLEHFARMEPNRGVLRATLHVLQRIACSNPTRTAALATAMFNRVTDGTGAQDVRDACVNIFGGLLVWQQEPQSAEMMAKLTADPSRYHDELHHVIFSSGAWLVTAAPAEVAVRDHAPGARAAAAPHRARRPRRDSRAAPAAEGHHCSSAQRRRPAVLAHAPGACDCTRGVFPEWRGTGWCSRPGPPKSPLAIAQRARHPAAAEGRRRGSAQPPRPAAALLSVTAHRAPGDCARGPRLSERRGTAVRRSRPPPWPFRARVPGLAAPPAGRVLN